MEKVQQIVSQIETLTVLELVELKKALEDKFGVTAAAPMMSMAAMPGAAAAEAAPAAEEQTEFNVVLVAAGEKKINVIKEVRAVTGLGLKEAKDLVEGAPNAVKTGVSKEEALSIKTKLEEAGASVEIK